MWRARNYVLAAVLAPGCWGLERHVARLGSSEIRVRWRAESKLQRTRGNKRAEAVRVLCGVVRGNSRLLQKVPLKRRGFLRGQAVELLWRLKEQSAESALVFALETKELGWAKKYAALALAESENPRALRALERATADADAHVRAAAVTALYGRKGAEDTDSLSKAFEDDPSPHVRERILCALERTSSPEAVPILLAASRDPSARVRREFVRYRTRLAQRGIGEKECYEACLRLLSDSDEKVARAAAGGLGMYRRALPVLISALDERGWTNVASALGRLLDLRALPALARARKSKDRRLREAAARALESYGPHAVGPLASMLRDDGKSVRQAAASSLRKIGTAEAVEALVSALSRAKGPLREEPLRALETFAHDPRWCKWSFENWEEWWAEAKPKFEKRDAVTKRVSSRSGDYTAVIRRHALSLLDREGKALWAKLIAAEYRFESHPSLPCWVSDRGWVLFHNRFISRAGEEPDVNPLRRWFPGEPYYRRKWIVAAEISPDGRHAAVFARSDGKSAVVLCDGQGKTLWKKPYLHYVRLVFSPDSRYLACLPQTNPRTCAFVEPFPVDEWTLALFSLEGKRTEVPAILASQQPLWGSLGLKCPSWEDRLKPEVFRARFASALRPYGALDCTPLAELMGYWYWPGTTREARAPADLGAVPWDALASGGGVLVEHFGGLLLFPRGSAPELVKLLSEPDAKVRRLFFEVLRKMAGRTFGYFPEAPEKARTRALGRWRKWAGEER